MRRVLARSVRPTERTRRTLADGNSYGSSVAQADVRCKILWYTSTKNVVVHLTERKLMKQQEDENRCEITGCSRPGTICPNCGCCFCWQHLRSSSCATCRKLFYEPSLEKRLARLVGVGFCILLCGFFVLLLPRDAAGLVIQLAISLLVGGFLLLWLGLLART